MKTEEKNCLLNEVKINKRKDEESREQIVRIRRSHCGFRASINLFIQSLKANGKRE